MAVIDTKQIDEMRVLTEKRIAELNDGAEVSSIQDDGLLKKYREALDALRRDGVSKIAAVRQNIARTKKNLMLDAEERRKLIEEDRRQLVTARAVAAENKAQDAALTKAAVAYANALAAVLIRNTNAAQNERIAALRRERRTKIEEIKAGAKKRIAAAATEADRTTAAYELKSALFDAKNHIQTEIDRCNDAKKQAFTDHVQENRALRNGGTNAAENIEMALKNYAYNFKPAKFFLDNGLYLAIIVFFIVCIIIAPLSGNGNLLSLPNIFTILEQSSTRMFYALGVAGLILLAGTDLSVGRMVALGAVITGLILHPGRNIVTFFGMGPWDFTALPMAFRMILALILSVALCTMFCVFAGFFSAKFKIHPFISTLSSQLIIYGLLFFGTSGTPVGSIDAGIKDLLGGRWSLGVLNGQLITVPKLIVPAVIAVVAAWFIWNKTTFGKNMYAVGGNAEAASVSGISVFWTTLGVFIMAGIFYGCGAFLEAFKANASAGTGQGYEMDAIAACVVGGISFNGGIGKISGAVIGVIIFTSLTYCLTFLGIDTNLQFVFKGLIIIAAVALDSIKYLKRK